MANTFREDELIAEVASTPGYQLIVRDFNERLAAIELSMLADQQDPTRKMELLDSWRQLRKDRDRLVSMPEQASKRVDAARGDEPVSGLHPNLRRAGVSSLAAR